MNFIDLKNDLSFENCYKIGKIFKTHANKGQLSIIINIFIDEQKTESIFVEFDNYLVPFFIDYELSNFEINPSIIKFKGVDTIEKASELKNRNVFIPKSKIEDIDDIISDFCSFVVNYSFIDEKNTKIGEIVEFVNDKKNPLFIVLKGGKDYLIPVNSVEIIKTDHKNKEIIARIPDEMFSI